MCFSKTYLIIYKKLTLCTRFNKSNVTENQQAHIPPPVTQDYHGNRGDIILLRGCHSALALMRVQD